MISNSSGLLGQGAAALALDVSSDAGELCADRRREARHPVGRRKHAGGPSTKQLAASGARAEPALTRTLTGLADELEGAARDLRRAASQLSAFPVERDGPRETSPQERVARLVAPNDTAAAAGPAAFMSREDAIWTIAFAGRTVQLPHLEGLDDLVVLISHPEREVHCLELMGGHAAGEAPLLAIDDRARQQYRARIRELQADIDAAHVHNDPVPAAREGRARCIDATAVRRVRDRRTSAP
jgi:hypothetical protein